MKIDSKKTIRIFQIVGVLSFLALLLQLVLGLAHWPPGVILLRGMVLLMMAGLLAFLWWLGKEADC